MKKIILLLFSLMFLSGCPDPVGPIISDDTGMDMNAASSWTAVNARLINGGNSIDLSSYFTDFKLQIQSGYTVCCINGCENWREVDSWKNSCNTLENTKDGNKMSFFIKSGMSCIAKPEISSMDEEIEVVIKKENPGFSFLPEEFSTGEYLITLRKIQG